jgi:hypothetical protein
MVKGSRLCGARARDRETVRDAAGQMTAGSAPSLRLRTLRGVAACAALGGCYVVPQTSRTAVVDAGDAGAVSATDGGSGAWPVSTASNPPVPMGGITVFAFSQVATNASDSQVTVLAPDINIRSWQRWDRGGTQPSDYDKAYIDACRAAHVSFVGGTTATALFRDEVPSDAQFADWATANVSGALVSHDSIVTGMHRGNLANPAYRAYLVSIAKMQIDAGVDGLFFDEVGADYQGATYDGNEGFDDYHLADFNAYLLSRYPTGTDFASLFGMTPDNLLRADVPAGDLTHNFNYRTYLAAKGWSSTPLTPGNPLAAMWGKDSDVQPRGPSPGAHTFTDSAEPYVYFRRIVSEARAYAAASSTRPFFITANGIWPLVDFESVGLYDYNHDNADGSSVDYVPLTADNHLDGTRSLNGAFVSLKARSEQLAPGAPVVLFIDWPSGPMTRYQSLAPTEQGDYWRIYLAEAYASGIFYAFHLADTVGDPTATASGLMPLFHGLASFYRSHAGVYHGVSASSAVATSTLPAATVSVMDQVQPHRRIVHVVNHSYAAGIVSQQNVGLTIPVDAKPSSVVWASPDIARDTPLASTFASGLLSVTIPTLDAYSVVVVLY